MIHKLLSRSLAWLYGKALISCVRLSRWALLTTFELQSQKKTRFYRSAKDNLSACASHFFSESQNNFAQNHKSQNSLAQNLKTPPYPEY